MIIGIQDEILRLQSLGLLERLLIDKTTQTNILWATDAYNILGENYQRDKEIEVHLITGEHSGIITNRAGKALVQQSERTRQHAEVFTPLWICAKMNDYADEMWFGKTDVFHKNGEPTDRVIFPKRKRWQKYVDSRRLEITCGEAPFLVSRYDVSTGEAIPIERRIGILDRKLRVVGENTATEEEWLTWAIRAFQATYGYEFQGDNLLIARLNMLMTFEEYLYARWQRKPTLAEYNKITNIIAWNLWQMDGLTKTIPYCKARDDCEQLSMFELLSLEVTADEPQSQPRCRIQNWLGERSVEFSDLPIGGNHRMKFDFIVGNPPYQESGTTNNRAEPLYPYFYQEVEHLTDTYILISPARFLFNAGLTPKKWNEKMLSDTHIRLVQYYHDSAHVFPNVNINGGVVIIYRDASKDFDPIEIFIPDDILRGIADKIKSRHEESLSTIIFGGRSALKFNASFIADYPFTAAKILELLQKEHPEIQKLGPNEEYELKTSSFERTPWAFVDQEPHDPENYYKVLGIEKGRRVFKWVLRKYMTPRYPSKNNIEGFKVMLSKADGAAGQIGKPVPARIIGKPLVAEPGTSSFPTFISIGNFHTEEEAQNAAKYVKTRFARALLGVLKVTQDITPEKWKYVPLQDFTAASDIDWALPLPEIDRQLYAKYGLDDDEIAFIESHVKEVD